MRTRRLLESAKTRRLMTLVFVLGILFVAPRSAFASPRIVLLSEESDSVADSLQSFDSVEGQLGELSVDLVVAHFPGRLSEKESSHFAQRRATEAGAIAAIWLARELGDVVRIYALHVPSGRVFARDVELSGSRALQREEVSVVLRATIPAILDGGDDLGSTVLVVPSGSPSQPPEPPEKAVPPDSTEREGNRPASPEPPTFQIYAGYVVINLAKKSAWQSGGALGAVAHWSSIWQASFEVGYSGPTTLLGDGANAVITRVPLVARYGAGLHRGRVRGGFEAGPLLELSHRRTEVLSSALVPTSPSWTARSGVVASIRVEVDVTGRLGLYFLAESQWMFFPHTLDIASESVESPLSVRRFRPHFALGFSFDVSKGS